MARGRQQKWICKICKAEFSVQNTAPKFCCSCGSANIGRAPSPELLENYEFYDREIRSLAKELNEAYELYADKKTEYDKVLAYWRQQYRRGYITKEQLTEYAELFKGSKSSGGTANGKDEETEQ